MGSTPIWFVKVVFFKSCELRLVNAVVVYNFQPPLLQVSPNFLSDESWLKKLFHGAMHACLVISCCVIAKSRTKVGGGHAPSPMVNRVVYDHCSVVV